jgi:hypothetical protein
MPRFSITLTDKDYKQLQKQANLNCRSLSEEITYVLRNQETVVDEAFTMPKAKCSPVISKKYPSGLEEGVQALKHRCAVAGEKLPPPIMEESKLPLDFKVTATEYNLLKALKERERIDTMTGAARYSFYVGLRHLNYYDRLPETPPNIQDFRS